MLFIHVQIIGFGVVVYDHQSAWAMSVRATVSADGRHIDAYAYKAMYVRFLSRSRAKISANDPEGRRRALLIDLENLIDDVIPALLERSHGLDTELTSVRQAIRERVRQLSQIAGLSESDRDVVSRAKSLLERQPLSIDEITALHSTSEKHRREVLYQSLLLAETRRSEAENTQSKDAWGEAVDAYKIALESTSDRLEQAKVAAKIGQCQYQRAMLVEGSDPYAASMYRSEIDLHRGKYALPQTGYRWEEPLGNDGIPEGWVKTIYCAGDGHSVDVLGDSVGKYICLGTNKASISISRATRIDLTTYPVVRWRWMATQLPQKGDVRQDSTDDQAIQVLMTVFGRYDEMRHINYIWDTKAPAESAHMRVVGMLLKVQLHYIVVDSGENPRDEWTQATRNIVEDCRRIFGAEFEPTYVGLTTPKPII